MYHTVHTSLIHNIALSGNLWLVVSHKISLQITHDYAHHYSVNIIKLLKNFLCKFCTCNTSRLLLEEGTRKDIIVTGIVSDISTMKSVQVIMLYLVYLQHATMLTILLQRSSRRYTALSH